MKKNILIPLMPILLFMAADAQAKEPCAKDNSRVYQGNFYARVFGGANFVLNTTIDGNKTHYQPGYVFAGSLGYSWQRYGLSLEGEYAFRRNAIKKIQFISLGDSDHGHLQTSSYMVNLLWDLLGCSFYKIQPFIGAGIGYDHIKMHSSNSSIVFHQKWNRFAWQAMAGFSYPIFRNTEITLEYIFHEGGSHFYNNAVGIGLVYKFGFIK